MADAQRPLQETSLDEADPDLYRSRESLFTLNTNVETDKGFCDSFFTRIPYATLVATILCALGVVIFCGTMYRGATLAVLMFSDVFKMQLFWVDAVKMLFVIVGACMGALGLMILTVGCLATGATRHKVYRAWRSRVGGRISCAIFMSITYILNIAWILIFCFLIISTFLFTIFWKMCANERVATFHDCIDFTQFYFMFPEGTTQDHMKVCGEQDVKAFCKDYVEKVEVMFILATVASVLVILSLKLVKLANPKGVIKSENGKVILTPKELDQKIEFQTAVHYLMCLAANYAHIRDHEKFQELQELQMLSDTDMLAGKDRF